MNQTAIVFTGKESVELRTQPLGEPREGEVLVEATRTLISTGTEMTVFNRNFALDTHWDWWVKYPFSPGYLMAGRVVAAGAGVTGLGVGDRVALRAPHASHVLWPAAETVRIPDGVSDDEAAWMGLGKIVQVGVRQATHVLGDNVVVIGLGLLGQLVVQYARLMGAAEVIAIDTSEKRLAMAKLGGATVTLCCTAADAAKEVARLTAKQYADVVYDVTGHPAVFASALKLARKCGKVVLLGDAGVPAQQHLGPEVVTRCLTIIGVHDGLPPATPNEHVRWSAVEMHELFLRFLARKQLSVAGLITNRFKPEQAAEAYDLLTRDRANVMGIMLEWK